MEATLLQALDDLTSTRSTWNTQDNALLSLERVLATTLLSRREDVVLAQEELWRLQDLFEHNISSRVLSWMSCHIIDLNAKKSRHCDSLRAELASLFIRALNLLQGLSLLHSPSKRYLGRRSSLEVLLDILSVARHSSKPFANSTNSSSEECTISVANASLALAVLDTFLCVLVDSPVAVRAFECAKGLEATVKLLRRSSIPKEVRMKCLEVLYLYLMDETKDTSQLGAVPKLSRSATPVSPNTTTSSSPNHSMQLGSSTLSSTPTLIASTRSTALTPPSSPAKPKKCPEALRKSYQMLRRDVDYIPQSPTKPRSADASPDSHPPALGALRAGLSRELRHDELLHDICGQSKPSSPDRFLGDDADRLRSTEEKKEHLGRLLGNVDALIEGVKNAGIWGLDA